MPNDKPVSVEPNVSNILPFETPVLAAAPKPVVVGDVVAAAANEPNPALGLPKVGAPPNVG